MSANQRGDVTWKPRDYHAGVAERRANALTPSTGTASRIARLRGCVAPLLPARAQVTDRSFVGGVVSRMEAREVTPPSRSLDSGRFRDKRVLAKEEFARSGAPLECGAITGRSRGDESRGGHHRRAVTRDVFHRVASGRPHAHVVRPAAASLVSPGRTTQQARMRHRGFDAFLRRVRLTGHGWLDEPRRHPRRTA